MKNIVGIKLADGSFYPIMEEGVASSKKIELTTVRDNQETVRLDLYKAVDGDDAILDYVDTLLIENLPPRPKEEPTLSLTLTIDEEDVLSASIEEAESGESSFLTVSLLNSSEPTQIGKPDFALTKNQERLNLMTTTYLDDVPREKDKEESMDFDLDTLSFEEDQDADEFEIDVPLTAATESASTEETLTEDSFPSFPDDMELSDIDNSFLDTEEEHLHEESFANSMYNFGDDIEVPEEEAGEIEFDEADLRLDDLDEPHHDPEFSFSNLYDKGDYVNEETIVTQTEEKKEKKGWLFILLIILFILLVAGFLAFLFFGKKDNTKETRVESTQKSLVVEAVEEEPLDSAKDNEIVTIESEVVVPEPVKEEPTEAKAVPYKIKWGDTLWDISNAYYKTPWLYPKIAHYNNIKNPDFIIAGTWINIPPQ